MQLSAISRQLEPAADMARRDQFTLVSAMMRAPLRVALQYQLWRGAKHTAIGGTTAKPCGGPSGSTSRPSGGVDGGFSVLIRSYRCMGTPEALIGHTIDIYAPRWFTEKPAPRRAAPFFFALFLGRSKKKSKEIGDFWG